ncbi:hypothetical protein GOP47_0019582 [Adiantum capillus-veneris]|uniref:Eukaryotic translation initiation factor 3 subunit J n=1 Tax=Adiantum capillus-veneris TaxID=13818 RepID=A0A9D4UC26_ADICA|nr:hypothetical protein GOP47_0019582 [Adiantum capillus-veneris]
MDDDWESEDFVPPPPAIAREQPKNQWDDEDAAEEEDVKESWEDEEKEEKPKPKPVKPSGPQKSKAEKKGEVAEVTNIPQKPLTPEEEAASILEEKLRQQRLVEESDYQSTTELFGKRNGDRTLDTFIPKAESDFDDYAELLAQKLRPYEKSFHYLTLLKALMRHAMTSLKAADAKEVASSVSIIANEKLKAEKEATGKKKTGPKKKQLLVDKPDEDTVLAAYDDVDDYDFM